MPTRHTTKIFLLYIYFIVLVKILQITELQNLNIF